MNQSVNGSCQSCCILLEVKLTVRRAALALPYLRICRVRAFQGETFKENDVVIFWPSHRQNREQDCLRFCTVGQMVPCNQDESLSVSHHDLCTGPLARSHALLTSSLAPHCALYLRAPLRLVVRLLALALLSIWESVIFLCPMFRLSQTKVLCSLCCLRVRRRLAVDFGSGQPENENKISGASARSGAREASIAEQTNGASERASERAVVNQGRASIAEQMVRVNA